MSVIWFASAVTVQFVPSGRSVVGSSVRLEPGEPKRANVLESPPQTSVNEPVVAVTDSLKVMVMFLSKAMLLAPFTGKVLETTGAASFGVTVGNLTTSTNT